MSVNALARTAGLAGVALAAVVVIAADEASARTIQGTATYRERIALPASAVLEAVPEDVSRADAPAATIASTRVASPGNPPIAFTITYEPARILSDHRYVVRARILVEDRPLFTSDTTTPVITHGSPTSVSMMLQRVGAAPSQPPDRGSNPARSTPSAAPPFEGTYWKAIELAGKTLSVRDDKREAHLVFQPGGRMAGSDGCNRISGGYKRNGESLTFGQMMATQMACPDTGDTERAFREALKDVTRWRTVGARLELFDATETRRAIFEARTAP